MTTGVERVPTGAATAPAFDAERVRADFPLLGRSMRGKSLVYLDNAATSQKPRHVIDAIHRFYETLNANVHRGVYQLSEEATTAYEWGRAMVARYLNAPSPAEVVFVRGATEGINLVASAFGRSRLEAGDEVLVTAMEHHSNIVPWQLVCEERGAKLRVLPMDTRGALVLDHLPGLLTKRTKIVAVVHVSNSLGTINDVQTIITAAHERGIPVLVDGAQAAPHGPVDVQALDCDFYAVSGHKMFGPTGIGALYGKRALLEALPPYQGGGEMIASVTFEKTTYAPLPMKFEAGTPNIEGAVGLGAAVDYLRGLDWTAVATHERDLLAYAESRLREIPGVRLIGTAPTKASVVSFVLEGVHPHDIGTIADQDGVAIRTGHHCTQPVMDFFGVPATARASFTFYNTRDDVDRLAASVWKARELFGA
ncbi:MAG: cysteine desulfurase [Gemmatimonadota bacterium]|nr:cysteine desulfurase [Gemmatimonadota bacterium]